MPVKGFYNYPLRLSKKDGATVARVAKESGQSINSILTLSIQKGLPLAQAALRPAPSRVTVVDPLPDEVLRQYYAQPDELDKVSSAQLMQFQSQQEPE